MLVDPTAAAPEAGVGTNAAGDGAGAENGEAARLGLGVLAGAVAATWAAGVGGEAGTPADNTGALLVELVVPNGFSAAPCSPTAICDGGGGRGGGVAGLAVVASAAGKDTETPAAASGAVPPAARAGWSVRCDCAAPLPVEGSFSAFAVLS